MSRTDELRGSGARDRTGGGGGAPFVKWGDTYQWIEGTVDSVWQTQFGAAVEIMVTNASPGVQTDGKDEDGNRTRGTVRVGEAVNVGLNNKMLEGAITQDDLGGRFHVAFEGWQEPQKAGANRYRVFTVLELDGPSDGVPKADGDTPVESNVGYSAPADDDLPF